MSGLYGLAVGAGCMISGGLTGIYILNVKGHRALFVCMEAPVLVALAIVLWITT